MNYSSNKTKHILCFLKNLYGRTVVGGGKNVKAYSSFVVSSYTSIIFTPEWIIIIIIIALLENYSNHTRF